MARSAFRRTPEGKFASTCLDDYPHALSITEEQVTALAEHFTPVSELAATFNLPTHVFWKHFGDAALRGYMNSRIALRSTLMSRALAGENWALTRLASSVLGFKDDGFDYQIPVEDTDISDEELTIKLRQVK